ncbi:hypothetical protein ANCCAN_26568 [Ancylostoma caninum]|uniref:Uncharacterized protein n=1 Tax=Ancylostoma caninum TaxID=29170 RepID=A0A368F6G6_ANCCA|nr:hypothetical protein ANCCAN_26568 [Ancylostoma caninum]
MSSLGFAYPLSLSSICVGRIDKDYPFVDAHKGACLEVAWSPFNDNVIASCSEDTTCKSTTSGHVFYFLNGGVNPPLFAVNKCIAWGMAHPRKGTDEDAFRTRGRAEWPSEAREHFSLASCRQQSVTYCWW